MGPSTNMALLSPRGLFVLAMLAVPAWTAIMLGVVLGGVPVATFAGALLATWGALIALGTALDLRRAEP